MLFVGLFVNAQKMNCIFPEGKFISTDIPEEEWGMEVENKQVAEIINDGESVIFSEFIRDYSQDCLFLMTVKRIIGEENEVKVGDRFITKIIDYYE